MTNILVEINDVLNYDVYVDTSVYFTLQIDTSSHNICVDIVEQTNIIVDFVDQPVEIDLELNLIDLFNISGLVQVSTSDVAPNTLIEKLEAGDNVTFEIIDQGNDEKLRISATGGGTVLVDWDDITNKPQDFPPAPHTHPISQVVNLQTSLDQKYDVSNPAGYITGIDWNEIGGNQSDINLSGFTNDLDFVTEAPIDNKQYVRINGSWEEVEIEDLDWDNISNKPTEFPPSPHTHPISQVVNLQANLDQKYDVSNPAGFITGVTWSDITGTQSVINLSGFNDDIGIISVSDNLTITGNWTFENNIVVDATPTQNDHVATVGWVTSFVALGISWQNPVIDFIDLTTDEPDSPNIGDRYINTVTGTSSETSQSVTEDYIYQWNGSSWDETETLEGFVVNVINEGSIFQFQSGNWVDIGQTVAHNSTILIQGGNATERYHLTFDQWNNVFYRNVHTTNDVTEGTINLFFTNARVDARVRTANYNNTNRIEGNWEFQNNVLMNSTPSQPNHLVTKAYADSIAVALNFIPAVLSKTTDEGSITPSAGDRYIVPVGATGVWDGRDTDIAIRNATNDDWIYQQAELGQITTVVDQGLLASFNGTEWIDVPLNIAWGNIAGSIQDQLDLWNILIGKPNFIYDNELDIVGQTASNGTLGVSIDSKRLLVRIQDKWYKAPIQYLEQPFKLTMGAFVGSEKSGYYVDTITDKRINNCVIGFSGVEQDGGIKQREDGVIEVYNNGAWQFVVSGVELTQDDGILYFKPRDSIYTKDVTSGNSIEKDINGLPIIQDNKISMGAFASPLPIFGGSF